MNDIDAKLDRIIELLEQLASDYREANTEHRSRGIVINGPINDVAEAIEANTKRMNQQCHEARRSAEPWPR